MAKLLEKNETKAFTTLSELKEFTTAQELSYKWTTFRTNQGSYLPLEDAPILVPIIRDSIPIAEDVSDDTIRSQMADTKICLTYPDGGKNLTYPVGPTAYRSMLNRLGAACPALTALADSRSRNEVNPVDKSNVCNILARYAKDSNKSLVLCGDEMILADLSSDYVRLPFTQLLNTMEKNLTSTYEYTRFTVGFVSHESSSAEFLFRDDEISYNLQTAFADMGIDLEDIECFVKCITSDVGLSGANIFPYIKDKKHVIYSIGTPIKLEHIGEASIEKFENNLISCFASFKDAAEHLAKMKSIKILNPADCFYNIGKKVGLPDKILKDFYVEFKSEYPFSCSGTEVYKRLFDVLDSYSLEETVNDIRIMQLNENITRICFYSMKKFDEPVIS